MDILISIQPQWVEKILLKEKIDEIRASIPKCKLPCKVYIYCTKLKDKKRYTDEVDIPLSTKKWMGNGRVVAEFTLKKTECFTTDYRRNIEQTNRILKNACLSFEQAQDYELNKHCLYAWHIDDLVVYEEPKELSEFRTEVKYKNNACRNKNGSYIVKSFQTISRPPQSWYYCTKI